MVSGVQMPSQCPDTGLSPEKCAYKPLRIKRFHRVSTGNQHPYLLKSRYGKVSKMCPMCSGEIHSGAFVSRRDNKTRICALCAAFEDLSEREVWHSALQKRTQVKSPPN